MKIEMIDENKESLPGVVSGDVFEDLHMFHEKYGFKHEHMTANGLLNRLEFLMEEFTETVTAAAELDAHDVVDGLIDLIVVASGTLDLFCDRGHAYEAWKKVMLANHGKVIGTNAKRPNSEGVDLVKPNGWTPPNLTDQSVKLQTWFDGLTLPERVALKKKLFDLIGVRDREPVNASPTPPRRAVQVLQECADVIARKSADYNGGPVTAADYYPRGVDDFVYMIDVLKRNRQDSLIHKIKHGGEVKNESLRDTLIDRINYLALCVEWLDGETPGQDPDLDPFMRQKPREVLRGA